MSAIRLAVFDCDGTLSDGQAGVCHAMDTAFAVAGLPAPDQHLVRRIVGLSLPQAVRHLAPDAAPEQQAAAVEAYKAAFRASREDGSLREPLYPGIVDLLHRLHGHGWTLAVATGALSSAVLVANNLRDIPTDAVTGKITLAVRIGDARTRMLYQGLLVLAGALTLVLMMATPWCAVGLIAVPAAVRAAGPVRRGQGGRELIPVLRDTGLTMLVWSIAVATALTLGA